MKVLVVKQPWAWLIVNGYKDIENRSWSTPYRGPLLIQSSKRTSPEDMREAREFATLLGVQIPDDLPAGGIVGITNVVDCVSASSSPWFFGPIGWQLEGSRPVAFVPCSGRLGLFDAPAELLERIVTIA